MLFERFFLKTPAVVQGSLVL